MSINDDEKAILILHRIEKSYNAYNDAMFNFEGGRYSLTANRLYYSLFHACGALLLSINKVSSSHSGLRVLINQYFIKEGILEKNDNKLLHDMFNFRQKCDYDDFVEVSKEEIESFFVPVKNLLDRIAAILKVGADN